MKDIGHRLAVDSLEFVHELIDTSTEKIDDYESNPLVFHRRLSWSARYAYDVTPFVRRSFNELVQQCRTRYAIGAPNASNA